VAVALSPCGVVRVFQWVGGPQGLTQHAYDKRETIVLMDLRVHADAAELPPLALKILRVVAAPELELNEAYGSLSGCAVFPA
jgi:hypothetical protein